MIFLTVGTIFPFDRLVKIIDDAVDNKYINETIFAQIGKGGYRPRNFDAVETLEKNRFDDIFSKARAIISHAGMGSITMALESNKPILVVPRLKEFGELVNNHQLATAKRFEKLGHVISLYDSNELAVKLKLLDDFRPVPRLNQVEDIASRIAHFLTL